MMRREGIDRKAAIARCEDVASYETDAESAVDTARAMAAVTAPEPTPEPAERTDEKGRTYIDLTPTWSGMLGTLRMLIENGDATGRKTAWAELVRMAALADERNEFATILRGKETISETLGNLATAANETAHNVPAGTARDELDAAIAAGFAALAN